MPKHTNNKNGHKAKSIQQAEKVSPTVSPGETGNRRVKSYATGNRAYNAYREDVIYGNRQGEKLMGRRKWEKSQQAKNK